MQRKTPFKKKKKKKATILKKQNNTQIFFAKGTKNTLGGIAIILNKNKAIFIKDKKE